VDDLLSEKEQVEQLREWWRENGSWVIAGIVLGVGAIAGWNYWQSSQGEQRIEASMRFEDLAEEVNENRLEAAETVAAEIFTDYPATVYADQARLAMARLYMDQGRDVDAADALRALIDTGNNEEMKLVARLRLGKILLYQDKPAEVIELLEGFEDTGFAARYAETIGDAHYELGDYAAAGEAYLEALEGGSSGQLIDAALVQMKINDLPGEPGAGPAEDSPAAAVPGEASPTDGSDVPALPADEEPIE